MFNITNPQGNAKQNLLEWLSSKRQEIATAGEGVKKGEPSYTVGGNVNWCSHHGKQCEVSSTS